MGESFHFFWSGPFSQWHPSPFTIDGVAYNCAEQYMMAEKARMFGDEVRESLIMANGSPDVQKRLGREVIGFDDARWKKDARAIVKRGNIAKFSQNPDLLAALFATGNKTLVEASPHDYLKGIGYFINKGRAQRRSTWRGKNWLGQVLTEVRDELQRAD